MIWSQRFSSLSLIWLAACVANPSAFAAETRGTLTAQAAPNPRVDSVVTEANEGLALKLVREELPALQKVLDRLRADSPAQYDKAVRDIGRSAKRLEAVRVRDEQLYKLELDLLKSRTTSSLLVARLKVRDDESDRNALKATVKQLHQAELARAIYEVETLQKRLQKTKQQLSQAQSRLEKQSANAGTYERDVYVDYLRKAGRGDENAASKNRSREKVESK